MYVTRSEESNAKCVADTADASDFDTVGRPLAKLEVLLLEAINAHVAALDRLIGAIPRDIANRAIARVLLREASDRAHRAVNA